MEKFIMHENYNMGAIGTNTGINDLKVGDIVQVSSRTSDYTDKLMVVYDNSCNRFSILGFLSYDLKEIYKDFNIEKIGSYKLVTEANIQSLTTFNLKLKSTPKLTLKQIKKELGYDFELVEE